MRGLIKKDLKSLLLQGKVLLVLLAFYIALFFLSYNEGGVSLLSAMIAMLGVLLPITALGYDEKAQWDRYALTMPISRSMLVWSKYLLSLLIALCGALLLLALLLLQPAWDMQEGLSVAWSMLGVNLLLSAVIYPVYFKLGAEKGRYAMMAILFIPTILFLILGKAGLHLPPISEQAAMAALVSFPLLAGAIFLVSGFISCGLYRKKEF